MEGVGLIALLSQTLYTCWLTSWQLEAAGGPKVWGLPSAMGATCEQSMGRWIPGDPPLWNKPCFGSVTTLQWSPDSQALRQYDAFLTSCTASGIQSEFRAKVYGAWYFVSMAKLRHSLNRPVKFVICIYSPSILFLSYMAMVSAIAEKWLRDTSEPIQSYMLKPVKIRFKMSDSRCIPQEYSYLEKKKLWKNSTGQSIS